MTSLHKSLEKINKKIDTLKEKKRALIVVAQETCLHPRESIIAGEYLHCEYLNSQPDFRVCVLCGYAEEGWGTYYKLGQHDYGEFPRLSRDDAMKLVLTFKKREEVSELVCNQRRK